MHPFEIMADLGQPTSANVREWWRKGGLFIKINIPHPYINFLLGAVGGSPVDGPLSQLFMKNIYL
jgi:hypothetical protein